MKTLVLSISFFVLTVSPITCSSELSSIAREEDQTTSVQESAQATVEIDPIVMPKKP